LLEPNQLKNSHKNKNNLLPFFLLPASLLFCFVAYYFFFVRILIIIQKE
jgi:hypothetical protein